MIGLKENKYDMLKIIKNGALNFAMTFRHPIYKNLKYLTGNKKLKTSFTTGCTCCNKRILINVNLSNSTTSTFNIIRMIIRNIVRR